MAWRAGPDPERPRRGWPRPLLLALTAAVLCCGAVLLTLPDPWLGLGLTAGGLVAVAALATEG